MNHFSPDSCYQDLFKQKPLLSYETEGKDPDYKQKLAKKLQEVLGEMPCKVELDPVTEYIKEHKSYIEKRMTFVTEKDMRVPCHFLIPKKAEGPLPAVICLQGHSKGMYLSLGKYKRLKDIKSIRLGDRDFGLQAVKQGYCALVMEQRGLGERESERSRDMSKRCVFPSMNALLFRRTMIGLHVWDVMRAIDFLETLPEVDNTKIACLGTSGGGTVTYYAACMDNRIKIAMPSCSVCTYKDSIGKVYHCCCNYLPCSAKYFDMGDLGALIAPRSLIVVAGKKDPIFPIEGVRKCYDTIADIYAKEGGECALVLGEGGHRFYAAPAWRAFQKVVKR